MTEAEFEKSLETDFNITTERVQRLNHIWVFCLFLLNSRAMVKSILNKMNVLKLKISKKISTLLKISDESKLD